MYLIILIILLSINSTYSACTCQNYCGGEHPTGGWCDDACYDYKDCCADYTTACNQPVILSISPTIIPISGQVVTLIGKNFGASASSASAKYSQQQLCLYSITNDASNCLVSCTMVSKSATQVTCRAPAGSGSSSSYILAYRYCILTYLSSSAVCMNTFTTSVPFGYSPPTVSTISPTTITTTGSMSITGTNFANGSYVSVAGSTVAATVSSSTTVVFIPPNGSGVGVACTVIVPQPNIVGLPASTQTSAAVTFSYNSPVINSLAVISGTKITSGGAIISIAGTNFGPSTKPPVATFGGNNCTLTSSSHTFIICTLPSGQGTVSVVVVAGGQSSSSFSFTYAAPTITSVTSAGTIPTNGYIGSTPYVITINGVSFGSSLGVVNVGGSSCSLVSQIHSQIKCNVPSGQGTNVEIIAIISGQSSNSYYINYGAPNITSSTPTTGSTGGGTLLTIYGMNFGTTATATVGANSCPVTYCAQTELRCTLPAGQGSNIAIIVTLITQSSSEYITNVYAAPSFASFNPISPAVGNTSGNILLTISGSNFGTSGSVLVGAYPCYPISNGWTSTSIQCTLDPGQGANLYVVVTVSGLTTSNSATFSYNPPTIAAISTQTGPTEGGTAITVIGSNFGIASTVKLGNYTCTVSSQSFSQIICVTSAGSGTLLVIVVTVGSRSVTASQTFSFNAPIPYLISPNHASTLGGSSLIITGSSFDTSGSVSIGGLSCTIISYSSTSIRCNAPAGQGTNLNVVVTSRINLVAALNLTFSYNAPVVTGLTPASGVSGPGNTTITIYGSNFGTSSQTVTIGGISCPLKSGGNQTHFQLVCNVQPGTGTSLPISITTGGQVSTGTATFSYLAPTITSISPSTVITYGNTAITIFGTSFGDGTVFVSFGVGTCASPIASHTQIVCIAPAGQGSSIQVRAVVSSQPSNIYIISYNAPTLSSFFPTSAASIGGTILSIYGNYFGIDMNSISISIGGRVCVVSDFNQTRVLCSVPSGEGYGLSLTTTISGQISNQLVFSYSAPVLDLILPQNGTTTGGISISIWGSNFGLTSTVTLGSISCPVLSRNHTFLNCTLPSGQGLSVSVVVSASSQTSNTLTYSYGKPTIISIIPSSGPTSGFTLVIIAGTNFGQVVGVVTIGGNVCNPSGSWTDVLLSCTTPAGQGLNQTIVVTVSGQAVQSSSNIAFSYSYPTVNSVSPLFGPTSGGTSITLTGSNFGISGTILVGSSQCLYHSSLGSYSHSQIVCSSPTGSGSNLAISLSVAGQTANFITNVAFSYNAPSLTSISPSVASTVGGTLLTISGFSFDTSGSVTINGIICNISTWSQNQVVIISPPGSGVNANVLLIAVSNLNSSATPLSFSFLPPSLSTISPASAPTAGGSSVLVSGSNFGSGMTISIGGLDCPVTFVTFSSALCTLPSGYGVNLPVIATYNLQSSSSILFSYSAPTISQISPSIAATNGNTAITVYGSSLGPLTAGGYLTFGIVTIPTIFWNHTMIIFTLPAGQGTNFQIFVIRNSLTSNAGLFSYSAPFLLTITPSKGPTGPQANLATLAITGTSFGGGSPLPSVTIGGKSATVINSTHNLLYCQCPSGTGSNLEVIIIVASQISSNFLNFAYNAPVITSISPQTITTQGSTTISLVGTSFGTSGAVVTVGGSSCTDIKQPTDNLITCTAPSGQGTYVSIVVTVSGQSSSYNSFNYSAPTISSLSPVFGPTNGGTILTLTGTSFGSSGSVSLNGVSCVVIPGVYSHTSVQFLSPAGLNTTLLVVIAVSGQSASSTQTFSYSPPTITSISPQSVPTNADFTVLTIIGTSFSTVAFVTITSSTSIQYCNPTGAGISDDRIECLLPAGRGITNAVQVVAGTQASATKNIAYLPPSISYISPSSGNAAGNVQIYIFGSNFGSINDPNIGITFNGNSCFILSVNDSVVSCTLPSAVGTQYINVPVVVSVSSQLSSTVSYSYAGPIVTNITSTLCTQSGNAVVDCPFVLTNIITVNGANFGDGSSTPTVSVGGKSCSNVIQGTSPASYSQLTCALSPSTGTNLEVKVTFAGLSGSSSLFSYAGPLIKAASLRLVGSSSGSTSLTDVESGATIYFNGTSLSGGTTYVSYGSVSNPNLYNCTIISQSATFIGCTLALYAVGSNLTFTVSINVPGVGTLVSLASTDTLSYITPIIVPGTIVRASGSSSYSSSIIGIYSEGETISFNMQYVGMDSSKIVGITFGTTGSPSLYSCTNIVLSGFIASNQTTTVSCQTPSGNGGPYKFQTTVLNVITLQGTDTYQYPIAPIVYSVSGCTDSGNTTINCPTNGGSSITIRGDNFVSSDLSVKIGSSTCTSLVFISQKQLTCLLPSGSGFNQALYIIISKLYSDSKPLISYSAASLASVAGCPTSNNLDCPRSGGTIITITGTNFGISGAIVIVAGLPCTHATQDPVTPNEKITCTLGSGINQNAPVVLIQGGGQISYNQLQLSYALCPVGTIAQTSTYSCITCSAGTYSDSEGLYACKSCAAGTYSTSGSSTCTNCAAGYFSTTSSTSCTACGVGFYSVVAPLSACISCPAGSFSSQNASTACISCFGGLYSATVGSTVCSLCPTGTFSSATSSAGVVQCTSCSAGSFAPFTGATACTTCASGTVQPSTQASSCLSCSTGSFVSQSGQLSCQTCPTGTFSNTTGLSFCFSCSVGSFSTNGVSTCTLCFVGQYINIKSAPACLYCDIGSYSSVTGSSVCSAAPAGSYSNDGQNSISCVAGKYTFTTSSSACLSCYQGYFAAAANSSQCTFCNPGTYSAGSGSTACINAPKGSISFRGTTYQACPSGSYAPTDTLSACTTCAAGSYSFTSDPNNGPSNCTQCNSGQFASSSGSTSCTTCDVGAIQSASGQSACTQCSAGKYALASHTACVDCAIGYYSAQQGLQFCTSCPRGYFQNTTAQTFCHACIPGSAQPDIGGTACINCAIGKYATSIASGECTSAPVGSFSNITGSTSVVTCSPGTYQSSDSQSNCLPCALGSYSDSSNTISCVQCPQGSYTSTYGQSACIRCTAGKFAYQLGSSACTECAIGTYSAAIGAIVCTDCSAGTYGFTTAATTCIPCLVGSYQSIAGSSSCVSCNAGTYAAETGFKKQCDNCPAGTYQNITSSSVCISCHVGTYSKLSGSTACISCDMGSYSAIEGAVACTDCPTGKFSASIGSRVCTSCSSGTFQGSSGATYCSDCIAGTFQSDSGQFSCKQCLSGTFGAISALTACNNCIQGKYSRNAGQGPQSCIDCPIGKYSFASGLDVCNSCPEGSFANTTSSTFCSQCNAGYYSSGLGATLCTACTAGSYAPNSGSLGCLSCGAGAYTDSVGSIECTLCQIGYYSNEIKQTGCLQCSLGTYSSSVGQVSCQLCPAGKFSNSATASSCIDCGAGYYQPQSGQTSCIACDLGTYSSFSGQTACITCLPGTYNNFQAGSACILCDTGSYSSSQVGTQRFSCVSCSPGYYAPARGSYSCLACPAGSYSNSTASSACSTCPTNTYAPQTGYTTCTTCPEGQFVVGTGNVLCFDCPAGTYGDSTGVCFPCASGTANLSPHAAQCSRCSNGYEAPKNGSLVCTTCNAGYFSVSGSNCVACDAGTYSSSAGSTTCNVCPAGSYQPLSGQAFCISCSSGTYSVNTGNTICTLCPPGSYSILHSFSGDFGATTCANCELGTFNTVYGQDSCPQCGPGLYTNTTGALECISCPSGKYSSSIGQTSCSDCPPGQFSNNYGSRNCLSCSLGSYSNFSSSTLCKLCNLGEFQNQPQQSTCNLCNIGSYMPDIGQANCYACPAGSFNDGYGLTNCTQCLAGTIAPDSGMRSCLNCAAGSYIDLSGQIQCLACPLGTYSNSSGSTACIPCPTGSYQDSINQTVCKLCAFGKYQPNTGSLVCQDCRLGEFSDVLGLAQCKDCPSGTYNAITGQSVCTNCNIGKYNAVSKQISCVDCASGTYSNTTGLTICFGCPPGDYGITTGSSTCLHCQPGYSSILSAQTTCTECNPGFYSSFESSPACAACSRGKYMPNVHATSCFLCPIGSDTQITSAISCEFCQPGKFSNQLGSSSCTSCIAGQWNNDFNQTACLDCPIGKYSSSGKRSCDLCPPGTYNDQIGRSQCTPCAAGTYMSVQEASACSLCSRGTYTASIGQLTCSPCPLGTYVPTEGLSQCAACAVGTFGNSTTAERCFDCPIGTFTASVGSIACQSCDQGTYGSSTGVSKCTSCPAGSYQDEFGKLICKSCLQGYYSDSVGAVQCNPCASGSISTVTGSTSCIGCAHGQYQANLGATFCLNCNVGKFAGQIGSTLCTPCPVGTYQNLIVASSCINCNAGSFQNSTSQTFCRICDYGFYGSIPRLESCFACSSGTYGNERGLTVCSNCELGSYQDASKSTTCKTCDVGTFTEIVGQASCSKCASGSYNDAVGQSLCKKAPVGSYVSGTGATTFTNCGVAYFTATSGNSFCIPCPAGQYGNSTLGFGQTSCSYCPSSFISSKAASTNCTRCPIGTYASGSGNSQCSFCAAGKYGVVTEIAASCVNCAPGFRSPSAGASVCSSCPPGYSTNGGSGAVACVACPDGLVASNYNSSSCSGCDPNAIANPTRTACICAEGFYSDPSKSLGQTCVLCPLGTNCSASGTTLSNLPLAPGYWRPNDIELIFTKCFVYDVCLGGTYKNGRILDPQKIQTFALVDPSSDNFTVGTNSSLPYEYTRSTCRLYSNGPLCSICESGSQKSASGICYPCPSASNSYTYFIGMTILICVLLLFQMYMLLRTSSELLHDDKETDDLEAETVITKDDAAILAMLENIDEVELASKKIMKKLIIRIRERSAGKVTNMIDLDDDANLDDDGNPLAITVSERRRSTFCESLKLLSAMVDRPDLVLADSNDGDELKQLYDEINRAYKRRDLGNELGEDGTSVNSANDFTWKMKIMLGFCQIISNMSIALQVPWPNTFQNFVRYLAVINFDFVSISSTNCIVETSYYLNFTISIMVPICIVLILMVFYLFPKYLCSQSHEIHPKIRRDAELKLGRVLDLEELNEYAALEIKATRKRSRIRFYRMLEFFLFLIYPTICSTVFRIFVCIKLDGVDYLMADMSLRCYTNTWNQYAVVAAFAAILYAFGIPAFFFYRLYVHRLRLEVSSVRAENGFLYDGYSQESWFFEMVDMTHKLILTSFVSFVPQDGQLIFAMLIVIIMAMTLLFVRPYKSKGDDRLHIFVQTELFLLLLCGYVYQSQLANAYYLSVTQTQYFDDVMGVILIVVVVLLFTYFVSQCYKFLSKNFRVWWDKNHPEEVQARLQKGSRIEYKYIDRRNLYDADDAAEAKYNRMKNEKNLFSSEGARMNMNPLFQTEKTDGISAKLELVDENGQGSGEEAYGLILTKNIFFQHSFEPEQIKR